jgi:hypothetical protein
MKTERWLTFVAVFLTAVILLASAAPALATPPARFTVPIAGSFVLAQCDGFEVIDEYTGWFTRTDFYDSEGNVVRITGFVKTEDRIYNSETGFSANSTFAVMQTLDPEIVEYFIRGVAYNVTVPGYGIVFFDSGLGIFLLVDGAFVEVQFSGNYQADTTTLCEAMDQ